MQLEPEERALIEPYLRSRTRPNYVWLLCIALGAVVCVAALLMLALAPSEGVSFALLAFVAGLVTMAWAMDNRRRTALAGVIQKLYRAAGGAEPEKAHADG